MRPKDWKCENCMYFESGSCFRYPPVVVSDVESYDDRPDQIGTTTRSQVPEVRPGSWCGEFKQMALAQGQGVGVGV